MEKFTVDFFLEKFERIPVHEWCSGDWGYADMHCAGGHCGLTHDNVCKGTIEAKALAEIISKLPMTFKKPPVNTGYFWWKIAAINDGDCIEYQQKNSKQRILAALRDIRVMQNSEQGVQVSDTTKAQSSEGAGKQKEKIRYVKVEIEEMELVEN